MSQSVQSQVSVPVAATLTVVMPSTPCDGYSILDVARTNTDGSQTLNEQLEFAQATGGPWSVQDSAALQGIAPGETRERLLPVGGARFVRTTATASGAGLTVTASSTLAGYGVAR